MDYLEPLYLALNRDAFAKTRKTATAGRTGGTDMKQFSSRSDKAVSVVSFKEYVCRYYHEGSWWSLDISAKDYADAEARVAKLGNLQLQGELMMKIPAGAGSPWLANLICKIGNAFSRSNP